MQKKTYLILFLVVALVLGAWAVSPAENAAAQWIPEQNSNECKSGADALTGSLAEIPRVTNRVRQICDFNIRINDIDSKKISDVDRQFIEQAIASNALAIQSLTYSLDRVQNEEWRGLIETMIAMHTHDLELAVKVGEKLGLNTTPDLTNVRVYPGTPDYDLGIRRVDLEARFLEPLMNAGGVPTDTPTAVPTMDMTGTSTALPTDSITDTPTAVSTLDLTSTPTAVVTEETTGTPTTIPTDESTGTPTPAVTAETTGTPTIVLTDDTTATTTILPTEDLTDTPTSVPTLEMTVTSTAIPTDVVTGTPTIVPTDIGNGTSEDFDLIALHIIEEMHMMQVQVALAAQRLVTNDEIRAFAKHTADMEQLHLLLMSDLKHRLFDHYTPPTPDFQGEYQNPRRFESAGG
ncbi:MAG TPA: hypothetical protein VFG81_12720 [Anaerolineales bacterium]|jgi:hypothetical protein|nr:hypothetical protein [Anaerolineales bacterium]